MAFKITATSGKARTGKLQTKHGIVDTPAFMPIATKASVKYILPEELEHFGTQAIISNAFILSLKPGIEIIKKHKDIHTFMKWNNTIFTDSGGFQMLEPSFFIKKNSEGIHFKNPFNGEKLFATPESIAKIQSELNSDVAMALDDVVPSSATREEAEIAVSNTTEWTKRFLKAHKNKNQLVFGITQGGMHKELRKKSAREINELKLDGIAIGGLCVGETHETMHKMLKASLSQIDKNKPRYLMGVGSPIDLLKAIEQGVDIFDSAMPTRNARHNELLTGRGRLAIDKKKYAEDKNPPDADCECCVCKKYTRSYIHHLARCGEELGQRLNSHHNLHFIQKIMKDSRKAISKGKFVEYKKNFIKKYNTK